MKTHYRSMKEKMCNCGDSENMHIDNMEQCFNGDCGCKEFEEKWDTCAVCGDEYPPDLPHAQCYKEK